MTMSPLSAVRVTLWILAAIPALLLVDTGVAIARGAAVGRLDLAMIILAAGALSCVAFTLIVRRRGNFPALSGTIAYLGTSVVVAWFAAEVIVAGFVLYTSGVNPFTAAPPFHTRAPRQDITFRPNAASFPGVVGPSHYTTNSRGLRGPEFPPREAAYRILTIGGSTTECLYLDDTETWQHLLMNRLNLRDGRQQVWIGSAGISGYPTVNHLRFVADSPLMEEVDALIFLIGANDLSQFLRGNLRDGVFGMDVQATVQPFWRFSPILQMVRDRWERRQSSMEAEDVVGNNVPRRRAQRQTARITDRIDGIDEALRQYESRVEALVTLARGHGLRPIFLTQPTLWDKNLSATTRALLSYGDITDDEYLSVEAGRDGIDRHNAVLMRVCDRMSVECVSTAAMHGQERFYYDDFHFNEAGAAELARIVGDHLLSRGSGDSWDPGVN
jgi:lysophospholipase L1-like esterase